MQAFMEFFAYVLPNLINDSALDINYDITEIKVDGDKATASVNLKGPDFPLLLIATANEVKKQSEKSDNLGIVPDYSELFKKCIKNIRPEYLDTLNKNCEFDLIKDGDKWKINFVENRKSFMEVIYLNLITFE